MTAITDLFETVVISLARTPTRRDHFRRYNESILSGYRFFDAIDGSTLDPLPPEIISTEAKGYTEGARGVMGSHRELWLHCRANDQPMLIFEDDAILHTAFASHLEALLQKLPDDWDYLQLAYNVNTLLGYKTTAYQDSYTMFRRTPLTDAHIEAFRTSVIHPTYARLLFSFGIAAYLIRPRGADHFLRHCFPADNRKFLATPRRIIISHTIDCLMNTTYATMRAFVCPIPIVITPHAAPDYESTISTNASPGR